MFDVTNEMETISRANNSLLMQKIFGEFHPTGRFELPGYYHTINLLLLHITRMDPSQFDESIERFKTDGLADEQIKDIYIAFFDLTLCFHYSTQSLQREELWKEAKKEWQWQQDTALMLSKEGD